MQLQNTCLHAWKSATNKQFNGLGFYSSSHLPRFEGVWWPVEGGEVTLNGKAARFHFWLQVPWMPAPQSKALSLCSTETCAHGGKAASGARDIAPASSYRTLATPGKPPPHGSHNCLWPKGICISALLQGDPQIGARVSRCQPRTACDPTGCSPLGWPADQCPVAALGHMQVCFSALPHPQHNFSS